VNAETVETVQIETIRQHCWQMLTKPSRIGRKCEKAMAESKHDMDELTERSQSEDDSTLYPPRRPRMGMDLPCKIDRQNKAENLFLVCLMQRVCADQASVRRGEERSAKLRMECRRSMHSESRGDLIQPDRERDA
jgi:hypothetical protein